MAMNKSQKSTRQIIAVDIDDVIAAHAPAFVEYSNKKYGTHLTLDDYQDHWGKVWKVDYSETENRAVEYHKSGFIATYGVEDGALDVLKKLKSKFRLIILSTRRQSINQLTYNWIDKYYPGIFDDIIFAGFFDNPTENSINMTKAELAKQIRADYLIDDQLKHCKAAADIDIKVLLFGDYPWNQDEELPSNIKRVKNWQEVLNYFNK
jgi:uncharacterized HAD superfamily protein